MADQTNKRLNIATNAVFHATALLDAVRGLEGLAEEAVEAGAFDDADFVGTDLQHLTAYQMGVLLGDVTTDTAAFINADALRKAILLGVRR